MKRSHASRLGTAILCCSAVVVLGCSAASSPQDAAGVRSMYRSIGIDASASNFHDICQAYLDARLREELEPRSRNCTTPRFEHWAEKIRLSKVRAQTRVVVLNGEAVIYDGAKPERARYISGQWLLSEIPELIPTAEGR